MRVTDMVVTPMGLHFAGRRFACTIGRGGVASRDRKREGDGATPQGTHHILGMLYRPDRMAAPADWARPIGLLDRWSDDPACSAYNHMVRAPHAFSHETLRRADPLYDLVLVTDWNYPVAHPHAGSAIFLHRWRRPAWPTAGCVALSAPDLLWIARRLRPGARLVIR